MPSTKPARGMRSSRADFGKIKSMDIKDLQKKVIEFRDRRDWAKYHNPKDLAISLSLETAELLEIFQWKSLDEVDALKANEMSLQQIEEEIGDILIYSLTLAYEYNLDPSEIILNKLYVNEKRYPADKVRGKSKKYTKY